MPPLHRDPVINHFRYKDYPMPGSLIFNLILILILILLIVTPIVTFLLTSPTIKCWGGGSSRRPESEASKLHETRAWTPVKVLHLLAGLSCWTCLVKLQNNTKQSKSRAKKAGNIMMTILNALIYFKTGTERNLITDAACWAQKQNSLSEVVKEYLFLFINTFSVSWQLNTWPLLISEESSCPCSAWSG